MSTSKYLGQGTDFSQSPLLNAVIQNLGAAPSSPKPGQVYYNTVSGTLLTWNGTVWRPADAAALTDGSIPNTALTTNPLNRANHTGSQASSTISDLSTVVHAYSLDSFAAAVASVNFGSQRAINAAQATTGTDLARWDQVQSLVASTVAGITAIKNPARAYAAGNLSLTGLQTVDGVSLAAGDRVLAPNQTTATQNGLYVVASGAWTLAADGSTAAQWVEGTEILIAEGTAYAGAIFRQTAQNPTITTLTFTQTAKTNTYSADGTTLSTSGTVFSARLATGGGIVTVAGGLAVDTTVVARKASGTITGDGTTTAFTVTHNLNTRAINPAFQDSAYNGVEIDWNAATVNTMIVTFGVAPANGVTYAWMAVG